MSDEIVLPIPNLELAQHRFVLSQPSLKHLHTSSRDALLAGIKADSMAPYLRSVLSSKELASDKTNESLLKELEQTNEAELKKFEERRAEAEKLEGETDVVEAIRDKANYLTKIGDKEGALEAQKVALEKVVGAGQKIDIVLTLVRIGFFFGDNDLISENLTKADELIEKGGDWDRRNRLKVYRGLHFLSIRQFAKSGELLLDSLSTFTASELISYEDFVSLTVIANAMTLKRPDLKKKIIASPEVISVLPERPILAELTKNLYDCHYDKFFVALAQLEQTHLLPSRLLRPHARYYVREMRVLAYTQLLESYASLTLESLANAFGVSVGFVDSELSRLIATDRLHCSIDKVHGVVETTRPGMKTAQYETVVRQGDVVLNAVQRLSKVLY